MLYSEKVMDHFKIRRNVGEIEDADASVKLETGLWRHHEDVPQD